MFTKYTKILLVVLLPNLLIFNAYAGVFAQTDLDQAYTYLNTLRQRADMINFTQHIQLQQSAFNHANYLADNLRTGHFENEQEPGFTGVTPTDRAIAAGFASRNVSENLSTGNSNSQDSIDGLFTAIYHRFGFLSFDHDLVGIGIAHTSLDNPQHTAYVYEMANQGLNNFCAAGANSSVTSGAFFSQTCANVDLRIELNEFNGHLNTTRGQNPNFVVWPSRNDNDVPPAFFEEDPDPLPDRGVSGNPISIQFNPMSFSSVTLNSFKLFRVEDNQEITNTRLLDQNSDPNKKFSELEFALYPLDRLDWNTQYRAEATYTSGTETKTEKWTFRTRNLNIPVINTPGQGENFVQPAQASTFAVYVPPTNNLQRITSFRSLFSSTLDSSIDFVDGNTLKVTIRSANVGSLLQISIGNNQSFTINFDSKAIFNVANNSISLPAVDLINNGVSAGRVSVQLSLASTSPEVRVALNGGVGTTDSNMPTTASYDMQTARLSIPALDINGQSLAVTLELVPNTDPLQFKLLQ